MKLKGKPESKIPTTKTNTNKRKVPAGTNAEKKIEYSIIKKNEFALILFGALMLTVIIFFLFFRSSGTKIESNIKKSTASTSFAELETRIEKIEQILQIQDKSLNPDGKSKIQGIDPVKERVTRLETAFSVKFDSLIERMGKLERNISQIKKRPVVAKASKPAVKKAVIPVKKSITKEKKSSMFHTVQKGETIYSISKKYNTSIKTLQKLNNFTKSTKIYPGNNILIR
ncbi:MAG: LysM peptidoglycan-binding domain-containing protein [Desulfobacteraceae bacterium]|nr:LysM peptidoglycan-binding domain-containing protein [Desulfobacteraceae bacterium]